MSSLFENQLTELFQEAQNFNQIIDSNPTQSCNTSNFEKLYNKLEKLVQTILSSYDSLDWVSFQKSFPSILSWFFGSKTTRGWLSMPKIPQMLGPKKTPNNLPEKILAFLAPGGAFFEAMLKLQHNEFLFYSLSVDALPTLLFSEKYDMNMHPIVNPVLQDKLFLENEVTQGKPFWSIRLSAYELYIHSFLTYFSNKDKKDTLGIYLPLARKLIQYVIPSDPKIVEQPSYFRYHYEERVPTISRAGSCFLPDFFIKLFLELWIIPSAKLTERHSFYYDLEFMLLDTPSIAAFDLIEIFLTHYQRFNCISQVIPNLKDSASVYLQGLWESFHLALQPLLFYFFRSSFLCYKFNEKFLKISELWLAHIAPWGKDIGEVSKWEHFILDNFLFYRVLSSEFLYRCFEEQNASMVLGRSFTLKKSEQFLLRTLEVLTEKKLLEIIAEVDSSFEATLCADLFERSFDAEILITSSKKLLDPITSDTLRNHIARVIQFWPEVPSAPAIKEDQWPKRLLEIFERRYIIAKRESQSVNNIICSGHGYMFYFKSILPLYFSGPSVVSAEEKFCSPNDFKAIIDCISELFMLPISEMPLMHEPQREDPSPRDREHVIETSVRLIPYQNIPGQWPSAVY